MNNLHLFLAQPRLVEVIQKLHWKSYFNPVSLKKGKALFKNRSVQGFAVDGEPDFIYVRGDFEIRHQFISTSIEFILTVDGHWLLEPYCDCGARNVCLHMAAVMFQLTSELADPGNAGSKPSLLTAWLRTLSEDQKDGDEAPPQSSGKPQNRFLAYCICQPEYTFRDDSPWHINLHVGTSLKNGTLSINTKSTANATLSNPPKYVAAQDTVPLALYQQLRGGHYRYTSAELRGEVGARFLEEAGKTGRLFFIDSGSKFQRPLVPGPEIIPNPSWEMLPDGSAKPIIDSPLGRFEILLDTEPPYLVSPSQNALNLIDSSRHSVRFLESWLAGPTLNPAQVGEAVIELEKSPLALPKPTPLESETLSLTKPKVHLHLRRKNPFNHGGLHLSGKPEPVVADLTFQYHDHHLTPELAIAPEEGAHFTTSKDGKIFSIPRDPAAEKEEIMELVTKHHWFPAGMIDSDIAPHARAAFLPNDAPSRWDALAAEFIFTSVPLLRQRGWHVTIDQSADLKVTTIAPQDLDTSLSEDSDQGIDWFRFGASYLTPEGDEKPLLPLLSEFIKTVDFTKIDELISAASDDDSTVTADPENPGTFLSLPTKRLLFLSKTLHELFGNKPHDQALHRIEAAALANVLEMDGTQTLKDLATLGQNLKNITTLPRPKPPKTLQADLRDYQLDGFHWMQFLARHGLHGILADDMGLGKTIQTLTHLQAEVSGRRTGKLPSLVLAPTSVVGNWKAEAKKFTPQLKTLLLHGPDRRDEFKKIPKAHLVITSYALLVRDFSELKEQDFHLVILDEAQYIKNPAAKVSQNVCKLKAKHRVSLSGTPLENHLGELWSQMRFLMPGLLGSSEAFSKRFRTPIEKHGDSSAQLSLNSRVAPLILRRTKDQVATELPPKTEILHTIPLNPGQVDIYETVRAAMDDRIRDAIADKGLAKSQIIVLDALLKLRQICCHPQLLKLPAAQKVKHSAKLDFLTDDLLPTLLDEGRKILIFSTFTTMLALIQEHLEKKKIPFSKITGSTKDRQKEIEKFQNGDTPIFLISLKAGGTGLNLTAADTVIHYDPWWNPAAENQATDRAYRIGQDKPVFVHKLITEGSIEERIVQLQSQKAKLVEALLSEKTTKLQLDQETLGNLLAPLE